MLKSTLFTLVAIFLTYSLGIGNISAQVQSSNVLPSTWLTTPEKTNYEQTSTHAEVIELIKLFTAQQSYMRLDTLGFSPEGKVIPMVVLANPMIPSAEQAQMSNLPIAYLQANIHAGEVEGKEALLMLLRDFASGKHQEFLKDRILLINPIYNTDSNDKMEKGIRPSQEDSPVKVGQRPNSQGYDLNRDGVKTDAKESVATHRMLQEWDPDLFVDFHTTNGTWHGYNLTWAPAYHTAGDSTLFAYSWYKMLPAITESVKKKYDLDFGPYGWYNLREGWPPKSIETYNHHPRYLVNQMGLRNRMAILSETFAHDRFYHRIQASYAFGEQILSFFAKNGEEIKSLNDAADQKMNTVAGYEKGLRFVKKALPETFTLKTYDYTAYKAEDNSTSYVRAPGMVYYENVQNLSAFEPTVTMEIPTAYYIPNELASAVDQLKVLGIEVERVIVAMDANVESFIVKEYKQAERAFQGHKMGQITDYELKAPKKQRLDSGGYLVKTNQNLGYFAFYVLEALSDDGLLTWNFLDDYISKQKSSSFEYPILRIVE
jgi:hypothetical protein